MTELPLPHALDNFLVRQLTAQALRYQVGQQLWCPGCQQCLDWQNAVGLDLVGKASQKLHFTRVVCGTCWDQGIRQNVPTAVTECARHTGEEIEAKVCDGRLFIDEDTLASVKIGTTKEPVTRMLHDGQMIHTEGYRVIITGCEWAEGIACQDAKTKTWWVIEPETGFAMGKGPTRSAAAVAAEKSVRLAGQAKYLKVKTKAQRQRAQLLKGNAAQAQASQAAAAAKEGVRIGTGTGPRSSSFGRTPC